MTTSDWLSLEAQHRPHVITLYFEEVDTRGHIHGPGSNEVSEAIGRIDGHLGDLLDGIDAMAIRDRIYVV